MSYVKSRTKKYDKKSVELRKEFEQLSKKSKDEFSSMESDVKTEILLREGLSKPRKMSEKHKIFQASQQEEEPSQRVKGKETNELPSQAVLKHSLSGEDGLRNQQPSPTESYKRLARDKRTEKPDLKTKVKGRLHEKTVPSIQADSTVVELVMQGQRVAKKANDTSVNKQDQKFTAADIMFHQYMSQFAASEHGPAKFAITGSQNTSMPISLTARKEQPKSVQSNHSTQDDEFMFAWSLDDSGSRVTGEGSALSMRVVEDDNYQESGQYLEDTTMTGESTMIREGALDKTYEECTKEKAHEVTVSKESGVEMLGKTSEKLDDLDSTVTDETPLKTDTTEFLGKPKEDNMETLATEGKEKETDTEPVDEVPLSNKLKNIYKNREVQFLTTKLDEKHERKDEDDSVMDFEEALEKLSLPVEVTTSDIVNVTGKKVSIVERSGEPPQANNDVKPTDTMRVLSTWDEKRVQTPGMKRGDSPVKNIHHFCSQNAAVELPAHLTHISRDMHTVDKHKAVAQRYHTTQEIIPPHPGIYCFSENLRCSQHERVDEDEDEQVGTTEYLFEKRLSEMAKDILKNVTNEEETLLRLQTATNEMFSETTEEPLNIQGLKVDLKDDPTRFYWCPAPPKLHLSPGYVRNQIIPAYQGAPVVKDTTETEHGTIDTTNEDSEDEEINFDKEDPEDVEARQRVLRRQHGSLSNIMDELSRKSPKKISEGERPSEVVEKTAPDVNKEESEKGTSERFVSVLDVRRQMARYKDSLPPDETATKTSSDSDLFTDLTLIRRPQSQPDLTNEINLCVPTDYATSMNELEEQARLVSAMKSQKKKPNEVIEQAVTPKDKTPDENYDMFSRTISTGTALSVPVESCSYGKEDTVTETESVLTSSRPVLSMTKPGKVTSRFRRKTTKDLLTEEEKLRRKKRRKEVQEFLEQPARVIKRSESLSNLYNDRTILRSFSLPMIFDYQSLNCENVPEKDLFEWVQDEYWYQWLDDVYPPSTASRNVLRDMQSSLSSTEKPSVTPDVLDAIDVVKPHVDEASKQLYEDLEQEAEKMTEWIEKTENDQSLALFLSRRGAIYRKLGLLKKAWDDLDRSIKLEPRLLDSFWHRHLLFLLNNQPKKALEDLTFIIKKNRNLVKVYRSMAEIYKQLEDSTMAILNYSQAIKLQPNDPEVYYHRATTFENRGDVILALEDYRMAAKLLPSRTEAMFNIGRYNFSQKNWQSAVANFTTILKQDPSDATAYLYRGKANAEQGSYDAALKDLSCAVHLSPRTTEAFYQRGCLLRKVHPQKALQDLSVSLLLDSTVENVNAFLHRAIIYTDLKKWDEAVSDFESALRLDGCIPSAHVNIGLICITKHQNYPRAIKKFTSAIRVDPTYIRGYICRAEANENVGNLRESVYDYTKAIHFRPDHSDYRMSRGKVLLKQNKLEMASFQIRQAAELSQGLGGSATQQAAVHAFLKHYDQAVDILTKATRITPSAPMFILLGKTCMKAKQFENAIASFKRAIFVLTPWHPRVEMPRSAAAVYFMLGTCYTERGDLVNALDAFNNAIKVDPEDAEAYYQRGLTKIKLRQAKSIHDFNRALSINPKLFQAFLSRAAYYGLKGRFSKGIMNCNEAIKLQPRSVRAYLYRGALKFHISAYKLAVRDLTEAIAIDCTCSLAYFNRAVCYQAMKYYQKALIDYSTVLLTNKEADLRVLQNRGLLYLTINDVQNALKDFTEAAKVSPNNPKVLHTLGLCYHKIDRLEDSVHSYSEALKVDPFFIDAFIGRGNALMDFGHKTATRFGRRDFLKALHINPLCLPARVNLGYNLQVENKFQQAWNQFTSALSIDKDCQAALEGRAIINLQMSNTFGAFVDMNDCIKISKTAELLTNRGVVQQFMGDGVNAMRDYQAAIKLDPCYPLAYYNAGNLYFRQRQFKQALVYFEKAFSWDPRDESAILNAAITKVLLKQYKAALCDFQKAIDLSPYSAHIYFNRGNLYASLGEYENAENDYTHALRLYPGDALTYKRRADVRGRLSRREEAIEDYKKAIVIQTSSRKS